MSPDPSPSDLLGAASLLLAALAVLYGVWYPSIEDAKAIVIPEHKADAANPKAEVKSILNGRALPLALASALATLVFAPEAINIALDTVRSFGDHQLGFFDEYDPIEAALFLVTLGLLALTIHVGLICSDLKKKLG